MYDFNSKTMRHTAELVKIEGAGLDPATFNPHGISSFSSRGILHANCVNVMLAKAEFLCRNV